MILLDGREGSKRLIDHLPKGSSQLVTGLPTDVAFLGNGPTGKLSIGIEHKQLPDALECIKTGRLTDVQIPELKKNFDLCLLMIETGVMQRNSDSGLMEVWRGGRWQNTAECGWGMKPWVYRDVMHWLWSVCYIGGVWLLPFTKSKTDSGWLIYNLYTWWQEKWSDHKSFKQMFVAGAPSHVSIPYLYEAAGDVSLFRRVAAGLPHVGWEISATCEARWKGSLVAMMNATEDDWSEMLIGSKGKKKRRFGKKHAREVLAAITGEKR